MDNGNSTTEYTRVDIFLDENCDFATKAGFLTPKTIRDHQGAYAQICEWLDTGVIEEYDVENPDTVYCLYFTARRVTPKERVALSAPRRANGTVAAEQAKVPS